LIDWLVDYMGVYMDARIGVYMDTCIGVYMDACISVCRAVCRAVRVDNYRAFLVY
jgi:hypothetical protein